MAGVPGRKNKGYTIMSIHHLKDRRLSLKAKGLLSMMLSLPKEWDYTLKGLARISREGVDAIREAVRELEQAGYVVRSRTATPKDSWPTRSTSSTNIPCPHPEARRSLRGRNLYWKIQRRRNLHRKIHAIKETRIQYESRKNETNSIHPSHPSGKARAGPLPGAGGISDRV